MEDWHLLQSLVVDDIDGGVLTVLQGRGWLRWTLMWLGRAILNLRVMPWLVVVVIIVSQRADGGLVVQPGGGGDVHSVLSDVRPVEGLVVGFV
jgi:hypothetical protein